MEQNKAKAKKKAIFLKIALVLSVVALTGAIAFYFSIPSVPDTSNSGIDALRLDLRGRALARERKFDEAIAQYTQALKILPGDYNILMDRGQANYNKKDYQAALGDYQSALANSGKVDPEVAPGVNSLTCSVNAMLGVALCDSALEQPEKAVKVLHELQAKDGHFIKSYQVLGDIYLRNNDTLSAIDSYTQGLRLNPDAAPLHFDRGLCYLNREMNQQAFDDFSRAVQLDKNSLPVYLKHANLANKMGKLEIADNDAKEILRLEPGNRSAVAWLKKRKIDFDFPQPAPGQKAEQKLDQTAGTDKKPDAEKCTKATKDTKGNELKSAIPQLDISAPGAPGSARAPAKAPAKVEPIKLAPSSDPGLPGNKKEENAFY